MQFGVHVDANQFLLFFCPLNLTITNENLSRADSNYLQYFNKQNILIHNMNCVRDFLYLKLPGEVKQRKTN